MRKFELYNCREIGQWIEKYMHKYSLEILAEITLSFCVCVFGPLEIFATNIQEFFFEATDFIGLFFIIFFLMVLLFNVLRIVLHLTNCQKAYCGFFVGLAICLYLQGNFFNLNVGVQNGADIEWKTYLLNLVMNTFIWCALILTSIVLSCCWNKYRTVFKYILILVLGIEVITAGVLYCQCLMSEKDNEKIGTFTDYGLYSTTTDKNIVVFILDMFDSEYMTDILAENSEYKDELEGFTFYDNYSGVYSTTVYSMSLQATGKLFYNEMPRNKWVNEVAKQRLYLDELQDNGYSTYFYWTIGSTLPERFERNASNFFNGKIRINSQQGLVKEMARLVICRYFPDGFKPLFWPNGTEFEKLKSIDGSSIYLADNVIFRENIPKRMQCTNEKSIKYIYLNGSHYPYSVDRNGKAVKFGEVSGRECAEGVLRIVLEYVNKLKEAGTFDNTAIVITADHGYYWDGTLQAPVMLIKPIGSKEDFSISSVCATQEDFSGTVLDLAGIDYSNYGQSTVENVDHDGDRLFYQYNLSEGVNNGNYRLIEYSIDSSGISRDCYHLTGVEYATDGRIQNHYEGCRTCKEGGKILYDTDFPREMHELED